MARINDFIPIEPEQIDVVNDLVHIGDVESTYVSDRRTTVAKFHQTAPNASASTRGYVTTGAQTISGVKTFNDGLNSNGNVSVTGNLTVSGNITQDGSSYETHAEKLYTKKDMIITRDGATGALATGELTGIKGHLYDGTNDGILAFDNTGTARVGDEGHEEPLLTRSEESDLRNNDLFVWDGTNHRAVHAPRPTHSNQALQSIVTNGAVTYQWGNAGSAGVAFEGTRTQYETAKLIPEGDNGYIPSGALVIITDENKTYITHGTGNAQTLSLQSSIMSAEANSGITITNNQTIKADTVIFTGTRAQWDALSSTQKAKFNIVNITDETEGAYRDIYSTQEVKTNKVWIDGKPIYNIVLQTSSDIFSTFDWGGVQAQVQALNISMITKCQGLETGGVTFPMVSSNTYGFRCFENLGLSSGGYIILEYTKTTD